VLSRWAAVRLPWPCFRRPPCDPGRRDFPSPVLTLAVPSPSAHGVRNATADSKHAPHSPGLRTKLVPKIKNTASSVLSLRTGSEPPSAQSPFACFRCYPQQGNVTHPLGRHYPAFIATTGSCASPHPSRLPRFVSLVPPVFAGCGQPLLGWAPSRRYLRIPCTVAWTRTPRCSPGAYPLLPQGQRPRHSVKQLGTPKNLCDATSTERKFRGCSHSLMFRLLYLLGPPVAPTASPLCDLGGRALYTTPSPWQLPVRAVASLRA
jgi:hypothetical protein